MMLKIETYIYNSIPGSQVPVVNKPLADLRREITSFWNEKYCKFLHHLEFEVRHQFYQI